MKPSESQCPLCFFHHFLSAAFRALHSTLANIQKGEAPLQTSGCVPLSIRPSYRNLLVKSYLFLDGESTN
jgi:hypothetical protein